MGALTIAFDITIVGALALPWVLIVMQLFFFEGETRLEGALDWVKEKEQQAATGVLLFAMTYTLGSAVSRTAHDFFNDDDLRVQVGSRLFRVGVTEDRIVASVYCHVDKDLLHAERENPVIFEKNVAFRTQALSDGCRRTLTWSERQGWSERKKYNKAEDDLIEGARDLFSLQENGLLLKGEDATLRLRQLHDQIMVLRGAAFNGLIGFSLCVFAWGAKSWREKPRSWRSMALVGMPALYFLVALIATVNHFAERAPSDPPYMEFTLFLLAFAGAWLVWKPMLAQNKADANHTQVHKAQTDEARAKKTGGGNEAEKKHDWKIEHWPRLVLLSALLATAAVLGWWSTEVLYAEQVVYSYDSQLHQSQGAAAPQK
jgi:hypothetical protein